MILEALYGNIIKSAEFFLNLLPNVDTSFMEQWQYIKSVLVNIFTGLGCLIPASLGYALFMGVPADPGYYSAY